jgi:hypothetical protein
VRARAGFGAQVDSEDQQHGQWQRHEAAGEREDHEDHEDHEDREDREDEERDDLEHGVGGAVCCACELDSVTARPQASRYRTVCG